MGRGGRTSSSLPLNYPHLQNLIKRDPASYQDEFQQQYQHFASSLVILQSRPDTVDDHFEPLVTFLSHVVPYFPAIAKDFPQTLLDLLGREAASLNPAVRRAIVQSLILLRKRNFVDLEKMLSLFFRLFRVRDKGLRELLYQSIVGEIRRANTPHRNNTLNRNLQNFMYTLITDQKGSAASDSVEATIMEKTLQVIIELYRRQLWNDAKTVNLVAECCVGRISAKVTLTALNFFVGRLGKRANMDGDEEEGDADNKDDGPDYGGLLHSCQVAGASKARKARVKRALASMKRKGRKEKGDEVNGAFAAIHLLNNPQGFAEGLFGLLKKSNDPFETKLLMMNVISRVVGAHRLVLLEYYSFLHRYVQPHQRHVTAVLAYTAQASHDLVPPDAMQPILKAIAHNFVADHCASEVIAAGLNGLREICARCPLAMDAALLQDLAHFKGYQDKGVMMAARSLIAFYREANPELLHKRDRGKEASMSIQKGTQAPQRQYGQKDVASDIAGMELLLASEISDGDLESGADSVETTQPVEPSKKPLPLAAQKILTSRDFAMIKRKRMDMDIAEIVDRKKPKQEASDVESEAEEDEEHSEIVDPKNLESRGKKPKQDYAARMESIQAGRESREKYGSRKGKDRGSTTNREKSKRKNAVMMVHKAAVWQKRKRSMRDKQKILVAHVKQQKTKKK